MNWLDLLLGLIIIGVAIVEATRGFGLALFDALSLYGALWIASFLSSPVEKIAFHAPTASNHCVTFGALFITFGVIAFFVARFIHNSLLMNAGMFDSLLGLCAGIAVGMILSHGIVKTMVMSDPEGISYASVVFESLVGHEMLTFSGYHSVIGLLSGVTSSHRELPNVNG